MSAGLLGGLTCTADVERHVGLSWGEFATVAVQSIIAVMLVLLVAFVVLAVTKAVRDSDKPAPLCARGCTGPNDHDDRTPGRTFSMPPYPHDGRVEGDGG